MGYPHYGRSLILLLEPITRLEYENPQKVIENSIENRSLVLVYKKISLEHLSPDPFRARELSGVIGLADDSRPQEDPYFLKSCVLFHDDGLISTEPVFEFSAKDFKTVSIDPEREKVVRRTFKELYEALDEAIGEAEDAQKELQLLQQRIDELEMDDAVKQYNECIRKKERQLIRVRTLEAGAERKTKLREVLSTYLE